MQSLGQLKKTVFENLKTGKFKKGTKTKICFFFWNLSKLKTLNFGWKITETRNNLG
jgi:hypothetical protein